MRAPPGPFGSVQAQAAAPDLRIRPRRVRPCEASARRCPRPRSSRRTASSRTRDSRREESARRARGQRGDAAPPSWRRILERRERRIVGLDEISATSERRVNCAARGRSSSDKSRYENSTGCVGSSLSRARSSVPLVYRSCCLRRRRVRLRPELQHVHPRARSHDLPLHVGPCARRPTCLKRPFTRCAHTAGHTCIRVKPAKTAVHVEKCRKKTETQCLPNARVIPG